jgi:hypothetical protein
MCLRMWLAHTRCTHGEEDAGREMGKWNGEINKNRDACLPADVGWKLKAKLVVESAFKSPCG